MTQSKVTIPQCTESRLAIVRHSRGWYSLRRVVRLGGDVFSVFWVSEGSGSLKEIRALASGSGELLPYLYQEPTGMHRANLLELAS